MKFIILPTLLTAFSAVFTLGLCAQEEKNEAGESSTATTTSSRLVAYETKLPDLLTRERLDAMFGTSEVEAKFDQIDMRSMKSVSWTWPSERTRDIVIGGNTLKVPRPCEVKISNFKVLSNAKHGPKDGKTYVERNYRSISVEEMAAIAARMKEQMQKKVEAGEITAEQAKLAGGLGGGIMGKERKVESIEGVGDAARWTEVDRTLAVGHGDVMFVLTIDISNDAAVNREKAIALAKEILKQG